jgi:hypothetical protein
MKMLARMECLEADGILNWDAKEFATPPGDIAAINTEGQYGPLFRSGTHQSLLTPNPRHAVNPSKVSDAATSRWSAQHQQRKKFAQ